MLWIIGFLLSLTLAYVSYRKGSLSKSGGIGAICVGTLILGSTGWYGFVVLTYFFVTSSFVSKWISSSSRHHGEKKEEIVAKGDRRDILQVLANGGVASLCAFLYSVTSSPIWVLMFVSSMAAATSDTWASELGRLSQAWPRDCFSGKRVEPGTSGAISTLGIFMSFLGALSTVCIALPLLLQVYLPQDLLVLMILMTLAGWLGNWVDTWVGALWQVRYQCNICKKVTEQVSHCDEETKQIRGIKWLDNDVVNMVCTLSAALIAGALYVSMFTVA